MLYVHPNRFISVLYKSCACIECETKMDKHSNSFDRTPWVQSGLYDAVKALGEAVVPAWITTKHLTNATLLWATLILAFHQDLPYVLPLGIAGWILTDSWDGHLGRLRNEGYVKWGYFADHAFDYLIFVSVVVATYNLLTSEQDRVAVMCMGVLGVFNMIMSFLAINENGMELAMCFGDKVYQCLGNVEGLIVLIVALFVGIDPIEKRIRTYHPWVLQGLALAFTLLTAVRFHTIQRRLSDEDEATAAASKK